MTRQQHVFHDSIVSEAGRHYARLHDALGLAAKLAGQGAPAGDRILDESARVSSAYDSASPLLQRRFDTLAAEISAWASAGVDALAAAGNPRRRPRAAAGRLAGELGEAMAGLKQLLRA